MSADYMVSLSLSFGFGGIYDAKPDKKGSGDTSSGKCGSMMSMGKAGKMFKGRSRQSEHTSPQAIAGERDQTMPR